jgi:hypothetical protein
MYIDTEMMRNLKKFEWHDLAIGDHDEVVTVIRTQEIEEFRIVPHTIWLQHWDGVQYCSLLDRTRFHDLLSSPWLVRIGHDKGDLDI